MPHCIQSGQIQLRRKRLLRTRDTNVSHLSCNTCKVLEIMVLASRLWFADMRSGSEALESGHQSQNKEACQNLRFCVISHLLIGQLAHGPRCGTACMCLWHVGSTRGRGLWSVQSNRRSPHERRIAHVGASPKNSKADEAAGQQARFGGAAPALHRAAPCFKKRRSCVKLTSEETAGTPGGPVSRWSDLCR